MNSLVSARSFLQTKSNVKAPQSGAIFGILKQMKESFEANLARAAKEENLGPPPWAPPGNTPEGKYESRWNFMKADGIKH